MSTQNYKYKGNIINNMEQWVLYSLAIVLGSIFFLKLFYKAAKFLIIAVIILLAIGLILYGSGILTNSAAPAIQSSSVLKNETAGKAGINDIIQTIKKENG
jgi:multisubunit Na+/H+ antiporter MnhC subunit